MHLSWQYPPKSCEPRFPTHSCQEIGYLSEFGPENDYFKTQETQGLQISKSTIYRCVLCLSFVKPRHVRHVLLGVPLLHFSINLEITHNNVKNDKNNGEDSLCYERKPISYKNSLHFDTWIQNSKKDKLL